MGLFDKLKPKYKHSDWKVRQNAIYDIDDQKILIYIAKNDENSNVRATAVKKLTDQSALMDIVNDGDELEEIKIAAIGRITDEKLLINIAKNKSDAYKKAVILNNNFSNQKELANIACSIKYDLYSNCVGLALNKITDEKLLINLAKNDENGLWVCKEATKRVNNQTVLCDIAKNHSNDFVREVAIKKINDKTVLRDIAENDKTQFIKVESKKRLFEAADLKEALEKTDDESILTFYIIQDSYLDMLSTPQIEALEKIHDETLLIDIAKNARNKYVRGQAINRINDKSVLKEIAKTDTHSYNVMDAERRLEELN